MQDHGASGIIYTDISKDGMMTGPNIEATRELVEALNIAGHSIWWNIIY